MTIISLFSLKFISTLQYKIHLFAFNHATRSYKIDILLYVTGLWFQVEIPNTEIIRIPMIAAQFYVNL